MKKDKIQEFSMRVTQASPTGLVVILYDMMVTDLTEAKQYLLVEEYGEYEHALKHAMRCLNELMATLDYTIPISRDLLSLYSFANKTMIEAMMKKNAEGIDAVVRIITKLRDAFDTIGGQDTEGPVMENTQQVYAGLTYGKGTLNESCLGGYEHNRGFKA